MRLRVRLFLLVLIAVVPAIAIQIYTEIDLRRERAADVHEQALRHARVVAAGTLEILAGSRQLLVALSHLADVQSLDPERCEETLGNLLAQVPAYTTIGAATREGMLVCSGWKNPAEPVNIRDRSYFRDALLTNGFAVGDYAIGHTTGTPTLHVAHPINRGAETIGVLVAGLDLHWLEQHFRRPQLPPGAVLMIADHQGTILAALPSDGGRRAGQKLPSAHRAYIFGDQERTVELVDLDGLERVFGYVPINYPPAGLAVAVGLDKGMALATIEWAMLRGFALILFGLVMGLIAAGIVARHFVRRPLGSLLDATRCWQHGDYSARAGLADHSSEIGQLGQAFDEMAERLQREFRQKDLLLREVNHRVMNSLQLLSSVLALQRRRIADPTARDQFEQARRRVQGLALVHRRLYRRDATDVVDFSRFLRELCGEIARTLGSDERPLDVAVAAERIQIETDKVIPLALIVYELLTNAFKYARPASGAPRLQIAAALEAEGRLILTVADNGPGLPSDFEERAGLGMKLVQTLLMQLRGTLKTASGPHGAAFTVSVPLAHAPPQDHSVRAKAG
jgi:two-component sensor histidine kinase